MGELLPDQVRKDFPSADSVGMFLSVQLEVISTILLGQGKDAARLYITALPPQSQEKRVDLFPDLPVTVNEDLSWYRHFVLAYPAVRPAYPGRVNIWVENIGCAQARYGSSYAVLEKCYLYQVGRKEVGRFKPWAQVMAKVWKEVEATLPPTVSVFTPAHNPEFDATWYQAFLRRMGYGPHRGRWWIHRR